VACSRGLELADVAAGAAFGVDPADVVVRAEVVVAGGGVGEQMPDECRSSRRLRRLRRVRLEGPFVDAGQA
jgi:hypothetical protein